MERATALELQFQDYPRVERTGRIARLLELHEAKELDLGGLYRCRVGGLTLGVIFCVRYEDDSAFCWLPEVSRDVGESERPAIDDTLLQGAIGQLRESVWILKALLPEEHFAGAALLQRNGFERLALLAQLECSLERLQREELGDEPVTVVPFTEEKRPLFETVLGQTFEGSLDCPRMLEVRTPAQALRSHELSGETFTPQLWHVFLVDGVPAGITLWAPAEANSLELLYLGIVPEFRRRGLARQLLLRGVREAGESCRLVKLHVDRANEPALNLYRGLGFSVVLEQVLFGYLFNC